MLRVEVEGLSDVRAFAAGLSAAHPRAVVSAVKGEAFRVKKVLDETLARGVGPPKAKLTQAEALVKGTAALAAFSPDAPKPTGKRMPYPAYWVEEGPGGVNATIGFTRWITRARMTGDRRRVTLVNVFAGGPHKIDRAEQETIARRIRKRMGEPVRRKRRGPLFPKRRRYDWADIRLMIPRVGEVLHWPERRVMERVRDQEAPHIPRNLAALYETALAKQRWARRWWTDVPGQVRLRGGRTIREVVRP